MYSHVVGNRRSSGPYSPPSLPFLLPFPSSSSQQTFTCATYVVFALVIVPEGSREMLVVRDAPPGVQDDAAHPARACWRFDAMGILVFSRPHFPTTGTGTALALAPSLALALARTLALALALGTGMGTGTGTRMDTGTGTGTTGVGMAQALEPAPPPGWHGHGHWHHHEPEYGHDPGLGTATGTSNHGTFTKNGYWHSGTGHQY